MAIPIVFLTASTIMMIRAVSSESLVTKLRGYKTQNHCL
jgi:hypothetical protein